MKFNGNITLNSLGQSEVQNLVVERVSATPAFSASEAGRLIYNTTARLYYMNSGLGWVALATGGDAQALQSEVDTLETSVGAAVTSTGAFNPAAFTGQNIVSAQSITDAINQLDAAVTGKDALHDLVDVAVGGVGAGQFLRFDAGSSKWVNHTLVLADVTDVTASATEVNYLVGVKSGVQAQIDAEVARATQAEADVHAEVVAETTRATGAEGTLTSNLSAEVTRATAAEGTLTTNLAAEVTRAQAAEAANATAISTEETRAKAAESANATAISDEAARATAAEKDLSDRITQEVADRSAQDTTFSTQLSNEVTRATAAETHLQSEIDAEVANRAAAVTQLQNDMNSKLAGLTWEAPVDEIGAAVPAVAGQADGYRFFNTTDNKMYTFVAANSAFDAGVAQVEGDAFFHKGDEVGYVFNGTALVQFNGAANITAGAGLVKTGNTLAVVSSSGTITVTEDSIDVSQNVLNSISKVSTDLAAEVNRAETAESGLGQRITDEISAREAADQAEVDARNAAIATETTRAEAAETKLTNDLASEVTRATTAEGALQTAITAEQTRATGAEATLQGNIDAEKTRAQAAEATLTTDLASEVSRATGAEGTLTTNLATEVSRAQAAEAAITAKLSKGYFLYDGAAATSHTVAHGIGSQFCNVTVIDSSTNEQIIPQSVVFDSSNQLTVTFNVALAAKVVVMGLGV